MLKRLALRLRIHLNPQNTDLDVSLTCYIFVTKTSHVISLVSTFSPSIKTYTIFLPFARYSLLLPPPLQDLIKKRRNNEVFQQKVWTKTNPRHLWFWKYQLFDLPAILTLDPLVESFSKKFYTLFVPYNKMLIVINFLEISFLQNFCPADHPGRSGVSRGCLLDTYFEERNYLEVYDD